MASALGERLEIAFLTLAILIVARNPAVNRHPLSHLMSPAISSQKPNKYAGFITQ
jgi:hypothetical protein